MRIKGPTDGTPPVDETRGIDATDGIGEVAPAEAPAVASTAGTGSAKAADAVTEVAARLRAGEITVDQAVELLIDDAIGRQVGRAVQATRDLEPRLRELLRGYASSDPFLAAKIRRLTLSK
jgi:hypothetical protein